MAQQYERLCVLSLEEGLSLIASGLDEVMILGERVGVSSLRLQTFLFRGVHCNYDHCQYSGQYFAVERSPIKRPKPANPEHAAKYGRYHLNLWAKKENGDELLFTHDHIIAQSLGGRNHIKNAQTMCFEHNMEKSRLESLVKMKLTASAKSDALIIL